MIDRRPTLLVVDDKRNMVRLMAKVMQTETLVRTAESGADALRVLSNESVNVVLCDLRMPDMDGLELLAHIRQNHPRMKVIMITAHANVQHAVRSMKSGAIDYIPKPFSTTERITKPRRSYTVTAALLSAAGGLS